MNDPAFLRGQKYRRIAHRRAIHKQVTVLLIGFTMGVLLGDALGRQAVRRRQPPVAAYEPCEIVIGRTPPSVAPPRSPR